jgi:hypothetical protein
MSTRGIPGPCGWASEFYLNWRGTCGQTSLAVCLRAAKGWSAGPHDIQVYMDVLTRDMINRRLAASNGAATLAALAAEARIQCGDSIVYHEQDYLEPLPYAVWHDGTFGVDRWAGYKPIVLQVANGQALVDSVSGKADEVGLRYHALAIVGADSDRGYIVADPDSPLANTRFQYYTRATLANARPCGMLILNMQRPAPTPPPPLVRPAPPPAPTGPSVHTLLSQADALLQQALKVGA